MKSQAAQRALTVLLATVVATPVLGVATADAASPGKIKDETPTAEAAAVTITPEIEERCANAATDKRTSAQVKTFMRTDPKSMANIALNELGTKPYYDNGFFGQGIDIALIDSGVSKVPGLDKGNVVDGPDLSWESQAVYAETPNTDLLSRDTFGHGTHLAGIMTGRDAAEVNAKNWDDPTKFTGIAPMARTFNIKVADAGGATDVTQVIAAIDWVVEHAHDHGRNIRVINLSYGLNSWTNTNQDALSYAVQQAWNAGIVVVAAAGNEGKAGTANEQGVAQDLGLTSPAFNKDIIAVGSYGKNSNGVYTASDFSTGASSDNMRFPDFAAWGQSLPSLHVPGSTTDQVIIEDCEKALAKGEAWTTPVIGADGRFVKASGTSQAAAVVSASVALMLSKSPSLSPEQVKKTLSLTANSISGAGRRQVGEGAMRLDRAFFKVVKDVGPGKDSMGWSSLDQARGDSVLESPVKEHCVDYAGYFTFCIPSTLRGNIDWLGNPIDPAVLMARQAVNPKKSPYCLDVSDYVAQKSLLNEKCKTPNTGFSPTAWTVEVDANGFMYERWNGGPGIFYTGQKMLTTKTPPAALTPVKWPAPAWLGFAWSDMDWTGLEWRTSRWVHGNYTADDLTKSRLRAHDFTKSRLRGDDFSKSRLRGSNFSKSRLRADDFTKSRLRNFGLKEFAWS